MKTISDSNQDNTVIRDYLFAKGFFIPNNSFLSKEDFESKDCNTFINDIIISIFIENFKLFAIIQSDYLVKESQYKQKVIDIVNSNDDLTSFTTEDNALFFILKKKEEEFIKKNIKELSENALDLINYYNEGDNIKEIEESIQEQERLNRKVLLPIITKCSIRDITSNSAIVSIKEISLKTILQKNRSIKRNFHLKYNNSSLTYRLYLYNASKGEYTIISSEAIIEDKDKGMILFSLKDLKGNHCYMFKLSIVFDNEFISLPKKSFYFYTKEDSNKGYSLYGYGSNEKGELILTKPSILNQITSIHSSINDFSIMDTQTLLALSSGEVVNSGKCWLGKVNEDLSFEQEYLNSSNIEINYSDPFIIAFPNKTYIRKVATGNEHCIALSNQGECYSWGSNTFGQLGLGIEKTLVVGKPQKITFTYDSESVFITDISAGMNHNIALGLARIKSIPFSWGFNQGGEQSFIGHDIFCSSLPKSLIFLESENIINVYAKYNTSAIIVKNKTKEINHIYTFGMNLFDQLGFKNSLSDSRKNWDLPTLVDYFSDNGISVLDVSFSDKYAAFLTKKPNNENHEVYLTGTCTFIQKTPMILPYLLNIESEYGDIESVCATVTALYIILKDQRIIVIKSSINNKEILTMNNNNNDNLRLMKNEGMKDNLLMMLKNTN